MSQVTSRDGTTIAFERAGDGPAVILVDGALCDRALGPSAPLADALVTDFAVVRYDRRGRGESGDTAPYAPAREVEDLDAVITATGGPVSLLGLSSGAALALEAAASGLPIARLALYEPPFSLDPAEDTGYVERLHELIAAGQRGDAVEWFLSNAGVPAGMRAQPDWPRYEAVAPTLAYDHALLGDGAIPRERAARITAPTLVANGEHSPEFFADAARATAAAIPGARHRILQGQAWGRTDPRALAELLRELLKPRPGPAPA
jgi:pimeloyl-ACP methyl ester carboxylesterase